MNSSPAFGYISATAGCIFSLLHLISFVEAGLVYMPTFQNLNVSSPQNLSAFTGEILVFIAARGSLTILPAIFLLLALVKFKLYSQWFIYFCIVAGIYFCILFPIGTIVGVAILWISLTAPHRGSKKTGKL